MIVCTALLFAGIVYAAPSPKAQVLAPVVAAAAPAVVTATSSQVIARHYNGLAAPLIAAPAVAPAVAPVAATPFVASPYAAAAAYPAYASPYFTLY